MFQSIYRHLQHADSQKVAEGHRMSDSEYSWADPSEYAATFTKLFIPFIISYVYS